MRYKVGDIIRIRENLEVGKGYGKRNFILRMSENKGKIAKIIGSTGNEYQLDIDRGRWYWSDEMLRPVEFKIWCETEEEKQAVLEELEKEGYVWYGNEEKPTNKKDDEFCFYSQMALYVTNSQIRWDDNRSDFESEYCIELTPSEFTGIDFSEKIIISKTPTGATAIYGDKTVTAEGDFEDASRQALAEVLCPFKVGDEVKSKILKIHGKVEKVQIDGRITVRFSNSSLATCFDYELEPYTEPLYNAKLFCIEGHGVFKQGVVYTVENGIFTGVHGSHFRDLEDINTNLASQFMEIKGGLDD